MAQQQGIEVTVKNTSKRQVTVRVHSQQCQILENSVANSSSNGHSSANSGKLSFGGAKGPISGNFGAEHSHSHSNNASSSNSFASKLRWDDFIKYGFIPVAPGTSRGFMVERVPFFVSWKVKGFSEPSMNWAAPSCHLIFDGQYINEDMSKKKQRKPKQTGPAQGTYKIVASHNHRAFDVAGGSCDNGADVIAYESHNGNNQKFKIKSRGSGYFSIQCVKSGKYLDVGGGSEADGAKIIQYGYHGGGNQLFKFEEQGKGRWLIKIKHSGKVLDINHSNKVTQHSYHGRGNQLFYLHEV